MIALTATTLFSPRERIHQPILLIEDGVIADVTSKKQYEIPAKCHVIDFGDSILAPAFIDIHVHGGAGHDVMESSSEGMQAIELSLAQHGVGSYFPTTVTAPIENTLAALQHLADAIEGKASSELRSRPVGIHLEGPFMSHARRGVHPVKDILRPSIEVFERFWEASRGHIRILTLAPELDGATDLIRAAVARGVCVSLGHSDATLEVTREAVRAGARHATHLFNGMRPLNHRDPGIAGEALTNPGLAVEIIADGIHLDPSIVKLTFAAKGFDRVILITDGTAATGMPDGIYRLGPFECEVKDGVCMFEGSLAGSTLTMDRAVQNVMKFAGCDLQEAVSTATLNPGRVVGNIENNENIEKKGTLHRGGRADIVVLTPNGKVRRTIIAGKGIEDC